VPDGIASCTLQPIPNWGGYPAPSSGNEPVAANPHLRWHPWGEWVASASHQQGRVYAAPEYNLAPTKDPQFLTDSQDGMMRGSLR